MEDTTELQPLSSARARDDLHAQVERAIASGARLVTGGKKREGK